MNLELVIVTVTENYCSLRVRALRPSVTLKWAVIYVLYRC